MSYYMITLPAAGQLQCKLTKFRLVNSIRFSGVDRRLLNCVAMTKTIQKGWLTLRPGCLSSPGHHEDGEPKISAKSLRERGLDQGKIDVTKQCNIKTDVYIYSRWRDIYI